MAFQANNWAADTFLARCGQRRKWIPGESGQKVTSASNQCPAITHKHHLRQRRGQHPGTGKKDYLKSKPVQESAEDFLCTAPFSWSSDKEGRNVKMVSGIQGETRREKRKVYKYNEMTERFQTQQGRITTAL